MLALELRYFISKVDDLISHVGCRLYGAGERPTFGMPGAIHSTRELSERLF